MNRWLLVLLLCAVTAGCATSPGTSSGPKHVEVGGETRIRAGTYR